MSNTFPEQRLQIWTITIKTSQGKSLAEFIIHVGVNDLSCDKCYVPNTCPNLQYILPQFVIASLFCNNGEAITNKSCDSPIMWSRYIREKGASPVSEHQWPLNSVGLWDTYSLKWSCGFWDVMYLLPQGNSCESEAFFVIQKILTFGSHRYTQP